MFENNSFSYLESDKKRILRYRGVEIEFSNSIYDDYRWTVIEDLGKGARIDRILENVYSNGNKTSRRQPYSDLIEVLDDGFLWNEDRDDATELVNFEKQRRGIESFEKPERYLEDAYTRFVENPVGK